MRLHVHVLSMSAPKRLPDYRYTVLLHEPAYVSYYTLSVLLLINATNVRINQNKDKN